MRRSVLIALAMFVTTAADSANVKAPSAAPERGFYRFPAIHREVIVFVAEGDLWKVSPSGGTATRLTTHLAEETNPAISPDGRTVAFTARYEGPAEVYTIPIEGGLPKQHSWEGVGATVVGWTPDGKILYTTRRYSTLPNTQLVAMNPATNERKLVPLAQASDGSYDRAGGTLFFTRFAWQGSYTKRYKGGTAQAIWRFEGGGAGTGAGTGASASAAAVEAVPLTSDYKGTSKNPMYWNGRVYFASDRVGERTCKAVAGKQDCDYKAGVMNIWSMRPDGSDARQHTTHSDYDVSSPAMYDGKIVYQQGADLWLLDLGGAATLAKASTNAIAPAPTAQPKRLDISITSDLEGLRDRWVKQPIQWLSDVSLSPNGDRISLIARGQLFIAPVGQGRMVEFRSSSGTRYRRAHFLPDGKSLVVLSDQSGEVELWKVAANGVGTPEQLTRDAKVLRWDALPSPDGKYIAHWDKNQRLYVYDVARKQDKLIAESKYSDYGNLKWSPDSKWLAHDEAHNNLLTSLALYNVETGQHSSVTSNRYDSFEPTFSTDGAWLYFLSDRTLNSSVGSPWGSRNPEPYFDKQTKIYAVQLRAGAKWPFAPKTELDQDTSVKPTVAPASAPNMARIYEVTPVQPGNYSNLTIDGQRLYYVSTESKYAGGKNTMHSLELKSEAKVETFAEEVNGFQLSADNKKILFRKTNDLYVVPAAAKAPQNLNESKIDLSGWTFALERREELQSLFVDAWRLERDYFYDPGMHGLDWSAIRKKYEPLAARVTDRSELNDVIAQMVGELSALHIFVRGGDLRAGQDTIVPASLGAVLEKVAGGWKVAHIYKSDPDIPDELSPLARPGVEVAEGDVITAINGVELASVEHPAVLLNNKVGKQVLLRVRASGTGGATSSAGRDVVVVPISMGRDADLRYDEWEYTRRLLVDSISKGRVGYLHLRAMGSPNMAEFAREYYPVFDRDALVVDVRHNNGGNIDSWILEKLSRKVWMYWQPRVGEPYWNMQTAFRGPMVTLVDESSASDGEAFPEGFRRLGLGKIMGTRTWGGEIWLTSSNVLADRGIATAAEFGVYGPDGDWLIEGHGVDPDVIVDNLPHATFNGRDEQLVAAVRAMLDEVAKNPNAVPRVKAYRK
jgi:tricorn protease